MSLICVDLLINLCYTLDKNHSRQKVYYNRIKICGGIEVAIFTWHDGKVPENMEITQVYGLIFSKDGRLLLLVDRSEHGIKYSLPGGQPEVCDLSIEETAIREIKEEMNITIKNPIIIGYQKVDEQNGFVPFAQVRVTGLIDSIGVIRPDIDNGKIYDRLLISPLKAVDLLKWGEVGYSQIKTAMAVATKSFGIVEFTDKEEFI